MSLTIDGDSQETVSFSPPPAQERVRRFPVTVEAAGPRAGTVYLVYPATITLPSAAALFQGTGGGAPAVDRPLATLLRGYQLHGGYTPGPFLLLSQLAGLGGVAAGRRQRQAGLACLLVTGAGVVVLLGADLYEFSWRYQLPALVTLPVAGALGAGVLQARFRRSTRRRATRVGPPPPAPHIRQ
jgi:hypothetical protein